MGAKILVLAEHEGGAIREITWELLGLAHRLAGEAGWNAAEIKALILGQGVEGPAGEIAGRGAAEVIYGEGPALRNYTGDGYDRAIEAIVKSEAPEMLLIGHTPDGWDVAPLISAGLGVPLATECSAIALQGGKARLTRKVFNGKFVQEIDLGDARPLLATVQKGAAAPFAGRTQGQVRKVTAAVGDADLRARFVEVKKGEAGAVDLTQASVIVSGGRGLGGAEKFSVVRALAEALGGQVGASRPVTDMGWLPHEHQIGSSGVTVSPKLYIACGISGAIQHIVGMRGSGYIVAINKDAEAPIFGVADVGVVGDLFEVLPALTKAIKEAKGQA
ncbi:MAG TPA: electron transfer flavoprotein subunit alpha/FixB family protein [Candidatus Polarisedimenticolia bacterium]|nr:electron transfer flavoprotein subunit alpha/FixB family protein [Candidatus Polarisedimenticolia bacterium]